MLEQFFALECIGIEQYIFLHVVRIQAYRLVLTISVLYNYILIIQLEFYYWWVYIYSLILKCFRCTF